MADNQRMTEAQYEQAWDQDRLQQQEADRVNNLAYTREQLGQAKYERDAATAEGDWETARERNADVGTWQDQERALTPSPQPQLSQHDINFLQRKQAFREKYGAAGDRTIAMAHARAVMPRNPNATSTTHPMTYGHGTRYGTPAYYDAVQKELEVNGHLAGTPYDANTDLPGWQEIAHGMGGSGTNQEKEARYTEAYWRAKREGKIGNR
jgi:hypothetical protein